MCPRRTRRRWGRGTVMLNKHFHDYLTRIRKATGYSQREFAQALGISAMYLNDLEHGRRNPPPVELCQRIAALTNTPVEVMYYYRGVLPPDRPLADEETMMKAMTAFRDVITGAAGCEAVEEEQK